MNKEKIDERKVEGAKSLCCDAEVKFADDLLVSLNVWVCYKCGKHCYIKYEIPPQSNKEKIAIYEELIEVVEGMKLHKARHTNDQNIYNLGLSSVISHLKGRIEELKKDV